MIPEAEARKYLLRQKSRKLTKGEERVDAYWRNIEAQAEEKAKADKKRKEKIAALERQEALLPGLAARLDARWRALGLEPPDRNRAEKEEVAMNEAAMEEEAAIREEDAKWAGIFAAKNFAFTIHVGARESQK